MEPRLTDEEIHRISQILSADREAAAKRENIFGCLGLPLADLDYLKRNENVDGSANSYGFFSKTLSSYKSKMGSEGTVNNLITSFTALELKSVVEAIGKTYLDTMENVQIEKHGALAIRIMNIISCFEPTNIPARVFWDQKSSKAISANENEVNNAVTLLKKYSMVFGERGEINVHRHVQRVIRLNIDTRIESVLKEGLDLLTTYMGPAAKNDDLVKSLVPHAESVWRHAMKHDDLIRQYAPFPSHVSEKLKYCGRYAALLELARDSKPEIERVLTGTNEWTLRIKINECEALYELERYADFYKLSNEIYSICKMENNARLTLHISTVIALTLGTQGKFAEQAKMYDEMVSIMSESEIFGPAHPCTLTILQNKATALLLLNLNTRYLEADVDMEKGRWKEALEAYRIVYDSWKKKDVLGPDHPLTLQCFEKLQLCEAKLAQSNN